MCPAAAIIEPTAPAIAPKTPNSGDPSAAAVATRPASAPKTAAPTSFIELGTRARTAEPNMLNSHGEEATGHQTLGERSGPHAITTVERRTAQRITTR